jgi:hypothetical protein
MQGEFDACSKNLTKGFGTVFLSVRKVRVMRMITDRNSRLFKGVVYVEFMGVSSVPLEVGLLAKEF